VVSSNDKRDDQDEASVPAEQAEVSGADARKDVIEDAEILAEDVAAGIEEAVGDSVDEAVAEVGTVEETLEEEKPEPRTSLYGTATPASAQPVPEKSSAGFVPGLLGGVTAAAVGFGAAQFINVDWLKLGGSDRSVTSALEQQNTVIDEQAEVIAALEARLAEMAEIVAKPDTSSLENSVGRLSTGVVSQLGEVSETVSGLAEVVGAMQGNMSEVDGRLAGMGESLSSVDERLVSVEQRPMVESSETARAAFETYEREVERLNAALADLEAKSAAAEERIAALQVEKDAELDEARTEMQSAEVRTALLGLGKALDEGAPYSDALTVLGAVTEIPEVLGANAQAGVSSYPELRAGYTDAARAALQASLRSVGPEASTMDRVSAFFRSQAGARSLEPREGTDADAVLSRAEAAVKGGDLNTALTELKALPEPGQAAMSDWTGAASTRMAVMAAAAELFAAIPTN